MEIKQDLTYMSKKRYEIVSCDNCKSVLKIDTFIDLEYVVDFDKNLINAIVTCPCCYYPNRLKQIKMRDIGSTI